MQPSKAVTDLPGIERVPNPPEPLPEGPAVPGGQHDFAAAFRTMEHDPRDPDPWIALYLDRSLPINDQAKAALVQDLGSRSRQFVHPLLRAMGRVSIWLIGIFKLIVPNALHNSRILHKLIHWGLKWFVSPQANFLILRHFHIGSEILAFVAANSPVKMETNPIRPKELVDVEDDIFLRHDLNLYNFVINLNSKLRDQKLSLRPPERLNFDMITDGPFPIGHLPKRKTNFIDLASAIEIYTPMFQLWLTDSDFWRSSNSLQLDETIAIYVASLLGDPTHLSLVNNKHPMVPLSVFRAGYRLILHGLASECLHSLLVHHKRLQKAADAAGTPIPPGGHGLRALWNMKPQS
jgi:hypothetical protein